MYSVSRITNAIKIKVNFLQLLKPPRTVRTEFSHTVYTWLSFDKNKKYSHGNINAWKNTLLIITRTSVITNFAN